MFASPIAWADDDHGGGGGDRGRGRGDNEGRVTVQVQSPVQTVVRQRGDDENENENENENPAVVSAATPLVNAVTNEVANLTNLELENEDADEGEVVANVSTISLTNLETGLSTADATAVTNAVNANSTALQNFLNNGTATANAIKAALSAAGINPASVLALLETEEHGLLAVTG